MHGVQIPNREFSRLRKFYSTDGDDAAFLASSYGLTPDPWQKLILDQVLGRTAKNELVSTQVCVSVPRQNGKNALLEMIELFELVVQGKKILHTAHEARTAKAAQDRLESFFTNAAYPELVAMVKTIRKANGQEMIELTNGGYIKFLARTQGAARGLSFDTLVMDEAQDLSDEKLAAVLPTISSAPSGEPQQIIVGTPPTSVSDGSVWNRLRESTSGKLVWAEWSAPSGAQVDVHDHTVWEAANPALGYRLQASVIEDELSAMDPDVFMRERLGMWNVGVGENSAIPMAEWEQCQDKELRLLDEDIDEIVLSVDVSPDRLSGAIVAAISTVDGRPAVVDVIDQRQGVSEWIPARLEQIIATKPVSAVIIDAKSPAASLIDDIQNRGIGVTKVYVDYVTKASGRFVDAVLTRGVRHVGQAALTVALAGAMRRPIGKDGLFGFGRLSSATDISPLVAATLAFTGLSSTSLENVKFRPKNQKKQNYTGKVVVM